MPAASPSAPALRQVGDYRVIREVGRGGMGVVYEAEQVSLGRRVALKILPGVVAKDRKALERFRREARAAARLHHTNIVPVFEVGQDGEVVFYAMQFIQGQGLDVVIDELARQRQKTGPRGPPRRSPPRPRSRDPAGQAQPGPNSAGSLSRSPASLPVRDRTEALVASLRARQVSRMARSLVTGTFAAEIIRSGPDRLIERRERDRSAVIRSPNGPDWLVARPPRPSTFGHAAGRNPGLGGRVVGQATPLLPERGPDRPAGRAGAGLRPCPGHHSPRHQAVELAAGYRRAWSGSPTSGWPRPTTTD